jgi:hypothetical protein
MRKLVCFLLLICGVAALPAAETWRWRDANGVVHYSDKPAPGAERVTLGAAPKPGSAAAPSERRARSASTDSSGVVPYELCVLATPTNDQVFVNERTAPVALELQPQLQADHQIQVLLNGQLVPGWNGAATIGALTDLARGTYTLTARVLDGAGQPLCISPPIRFHIQLPMIR